MIDKIINHDFLDELKRDSTSYLKKFEFNVYDVELSSEIKFDELQYFIHNVGFYTFHTMDFCKQLELGVDFLSNFNYKHALNYNRFDHLLYNVENYIVRFNSVPDRFLQVINSVFHLTNDEKIVNYTLIMSNLKVSRTNIPSKFGPLKKLTNKHANDRNTIIHRHSHIERELRKLELFYNQNNRDSSSELKYFRSRELAKYIQQKRLVFKKQNEEIFKTILPLMDELLIEYRKQRDKLKILTGWEV